MKKPRKIGNENVPLSWASVFLIRFVAAFPSRSLSITTASRYYQSWFGNVLFWNWSSAPIALVRVLNFENSCGLYWKETEKSRNGQWLKMDNHTRHKHCDYCWVERTFQFFHIRKSTTMVASAQDTAINQTTFCGDDLKQIDFSRNPGSAKRTLYVAPKIELAPRRGRDTAIQDGHDTFAV